MWTMLAGVPGKMNALLTRLTAARAESLDKLDATITSRAPAASALNKAVWSDARAAKLDNIQTDVLSLPPNNTLVSQNSKVWMPGMAPYWPGTAIVADITPAGMYRLDSIGTTSSAVSQNVINLTGSGVIKALWFQATKEGLETNALAINCLIVIDGVSIYTPAINMTGAMYDRVFPLIGGNFLHDNVVFKSSLSVTLNISSASGVGAKNLRCISLIHRAT